MVTAVWSGAVIAEAPDDEIQVLEGNVYFPLNVVDQRYLQPSESHTVCLWKGMASYYHVVVEGRENRDAAWYYPEPDEAARQIVDRIAFWRGVEVKRSLTS